MRPDIFISYCREDIAKARIIKDNIEKSISAKCWMDLEGIRSGAQFEEEIISAINNVKIVVFLLSNNSMQSDWTKKEIRYAYTKHKKIVPVKIDKCTPPDWFLFRFSGCDVIDINDPLQKEKLYRDLIEWANSENISLDSPIPPTKKTFNLYYNMSWICQFVAFLLILLTMSSMFFFGLLTMKKGNIALIYNISLCTCLLMTLFSLYLLYVKKKKRAFYYICFLDFFEIILLCSLSEKIYISAFPLNTVKSIVKLFIFFISFN